MTCERCGGEMIYGCGREIHVEALNAHCKANGNGAMDLFVDRHDV